LEKERQEAAKERELREQRKVAREQNKDEVKRYYTKRL